MIAFIGGGNMAEALIKGIASNGNTDIIVSEPIGNRRLYLEETYGIRATDDNIEAVSAAGIIILAVKPQNMEDVLGQIAPAVTEDKTIVSIAAGITLSYLQSMLKTKRLVRVMPNVAALVQESMSVISMCECFADRDINMIREIFMSSGRVMMMPEKHLDAVTALSGSGPAFIALFAGLLAESGVKLGLDAGDALSLAVQTLVGTSKLLDEGLEPSRLIEMVRSPGGTTAEGLRVFDEGGLKETVIEALEAAERRARELAR
jgi:pyrroline-5-carboxylate reductase